MKKFATMFAVAVFALAFSASASTLADFGTRLIKVGTKGTDVMAVQSALNVCQNSALAVDGIFGPKTAQVFMAFQTAKGIKIDGIVGPQTKATLFACSNGSTGSGSSGSTGGSATLSGGAGDLEDVDVLSTYSNEEVLEGDSDVKVMAFEVEADNGSDLDIQNVRLNFEHTGAGSARMNKYMDKVTVWAGSKEAGSADAEDFSEDDDQYSKAIALDGVVVEDGETMKLYVSVDAVSNVDSDDIDEEWTLTLESVRFEDADGAVITDDSTGEMGGTVEFTFTDLQSSGDLEAKLSKSTSSPEAQVVEVDETSETNDVALLEFKIKATGSDMTVDELQFEIAATGADANEMINEFRLLMNDDEIDSIDATSIASGATGVINFTDLEDEITIDEGDTVTFTLVADVEDLDGNFGNGDAIKASIISADFDDIDVTVIEDSEGEDVAAGDRTGSAIGETQTFFNDGIMVELVGTPTAVKTVGDAQASESDSGLFTITFDVTAFGSDIYVDGTNPDSVGNVTESDLGYTGTGTLTADIDTTTGADESVSPATFLVEEGTTERFVITSNIIATGTAGTSAFYKVSLDGLLYALTNVDGDVVYSSDLEDFKTPSISLTSR